MSLEDNKDSIEKCVDQMKWQAGWKMETKVNKLIELGKDYFSILTEANGRKIISSSLNMQALELVQILKTNKWTKDYFVESENNKLIFQLEIFGEYSYEDNKKQSKGVVGQLVPTTDIFGNILVKGALDLLRINHKDKTLQIVDLKKTFSVHQFIDNVKKFDYSSQLDFYNYLLVSFWLKENTQYQNYSIISPINICIDIADRMPYIYKYNKNDLHHVRYGNKKFLHSVFGDYHPFKIKKEWLELLDEIGWHLVKNDFSAPRSIIEQGVIELNLLNN